MLLNLKPLATCAAGEEKVLDFVHSLDMSRITLWGERPFAKPVRVSGSVSSRSGVYTVRYAADLEVSGRCSRCLEHVTKTERPEFEHTVLIDADDAEAEAAGFTPAPGAELNLDELVTSDLLLEFGGVVLCGEDCRGLCPKCGKNLNKGVCGCDRREPDPRFDVIRKLLEG